MRSKTFLVISLLILALGACNPVQLPANIKNAPFTITETPTPIGTSTNVPLLTQLNGPDVTSPALIQIAFQDTNNGWGIASNGRDSILRTADGGATWHNVTPAGLNGTLAISFFLDTTTGWVSISGADPTSGTLYHTTDGGVTWTSTTVPFSGGSIKFVDPNHGWELVGLSAAMSHEAVAIFRTNDGGMTWSQVFINDPSASSSSDSLPLVGDKNGIAALDASHGWVTGAQPSEDSIYIYSTQDGGTTWTHQDLTLPIGYKGAMTDAYLPVFFGTRDAILPVRLYATDIGAEFYISHDGGQNWTATTPVAQEGLFSIASPTDFFVWDGGSSLRVTHNAGDSWSTVTPNVNIQGNIISMEFVNSTTGWAITSDASKHNSLYKTIDGGKTWNTLIP